jgi:hypothetical protein
MLYPKIIKIASLTSITNLATSEVPLAFTRLPYHMGKPILSSDTAARLFCFSGLIKNSKEKC